MNNIIQLFAEVGIKKLQEKVLSLATNIICCQFIFLNNILFTSR